MLHGRKSIKLRERHTLHKFEIRVMRKIFRVQGDKEIRGVERN
jgi:hypothetical protein